ncbi:SDR family oxidoreductase [Streptomyces cyaneochromogenes]|uniref:SDR family oxidoreductase n=1 Tax=Streptomyces cyaneochromogenes TaxID=2496836 RepID=A0A3Q9ESI9_9ACTN|nr:SDR family oxidoreductase [Streptomyces cyaneochromogenes]AZQ34550.1 SDR family oxidoreductase [Streptomyces cyaneochromogenes]
MTVPHPSPAPRRALVVGGSTGIGRAVAEAWARAGLDVLVLSRSRPTGDGADLLHWSPLDLSDADAARAALDGAGAGPLDAVCYSAVSYGTRRALFGDVEEGEWRRQVEVNLHGLWLTLSATLPVLRRARSGLFLGISSEVVYNAGPGRSGYAATKAAGSALLDSIAQEEGADGVRVVQALPAGMVDTPGIRQRRPADFDYGAYMRPRHFAALAHELVTAGAADHHGDSLIVDEYGQWRSVREARPVSQSREVPA